MKRPLVPKNERGVILLGALIITLFFMIVGASVAQLAAAQYAASKRTMRGLAALSVAEAGAEKFMLEVNKDRTYAGSGGAVEFFNNATQGRATYETSVSNGAFVNEKVVISTGKVYFPATSTKPIIRKVRLTIRGTKDFDYALQSGTGPIYLYGSTNFVATVYSNSILALQDNAVSISGTFYVVGDDGTTGYRKPCSIFGSNARISGTIIANKFVCVSPEAGSTVIENKTPPLTAQSLPTVPPDALDGVTTNTLCTAITTSPYQLKSTHYPDSATTYLPSCQVALKKNTNYTLMGNSHIRGDLVLDGNILSLSESVTTDTYVIVEGKIIIGGNGAAIATNSAGKRITFVSNLSYYNGVTYDCNGDKQCNNNAIDIDSKSSSFNALFLAPNGSVRYQGRGSISSIAARSTVLNGNGTLTFIQPPAVDISDANIWDVKYYQQVYNY